MWTRWRFNGITFLGMTTTITYRRATPDDALCIGVLATQVFLDTYAPHGIRPDLAREALACYAPEVVATHLADPDVHFVLAEAGRPSGCVCGAGTGPALPCVRRGHRRNSPPVRATQLPSPRHRERAVHPSRTTGRAVGPQRRLADRVVWQCTGAGVLSRAWAMPISGALSTLLKTRCTKTGFLLKPRVAKTVCALQGFSCAGP